MQGAQAAACDRMVWTHACVACPMQNPCRPEACSLGQGSRSHSTDSRERTCCRKTGMWALGRLVSAARSQPLAHGCASAALSTLAQPAKRGRSLGLRALLAAPVVLAAGWVLSDKDRAVLAVVLPTRFARVVYTAAAITLGARLPPQRRAARGCAAPPASWRAPFRLQKAKESRSQLAPLLAAPTRRLRCAAADYKVSLRGLAGDALEAQNSACHQRSAGRLQRLCFANGGVYIKLGQHIAQLARPAPPRRAGQDTPCVSCPGVLATRRTETAARRAGPSAAEGVRGDDAADDAVALPRVALQRGRAHGGGGPGRAAERAVRVGGGGADRLGVPRAGAPRAGSRPPWAAAPSRRARRPARSAAQPAARRARAGAPRGGPRRAAAGRQGAACAAARQLRGGHPDGRDRRARGAPHLPQLQLPVAGRRDEGQPAEGWGAAQHALGAATAPMGPCFTECSWARAQELDFEVEVANAERCRHNLASPSSSVSRPLICLCPP